MLAKINPTDECCGDGWGAVLPQPITLGACAPKQLAAGLSDSTGVSVLLNAQLVLHDTGATIIPNSFLK
jgi:hypothetical protein